MASPSITGTVGILIAAGITVAVSGCGSSASAPASTSASSAPTSASASVSPTSAWPSDVPAPTGLHIGSINNAQNRVYYGTGTMDSVSAQMIQSFTDAGYAPQEGVSRVTRNDVLMVFAKGSTRVMMIVTPTGKNEVACALRLSSA